MIMKYALVVTAHCLSVSRSFSSDMTVIVSLITVVLSHAQSFCQLGIPAFSWVFPAHLALLVSVLESRYLPFTLVLIWTLELSLMDAYDRETTASFARHCFSQVSSTYNLLLVNFSSLKLLLKFSVLPSNLRPTRNFCRRVALR